MRGGETRTGARLGRRDGAEGRTRTGTGYPTRPSNVRVYQFRHFGSGMHESIFSSFQFQFGGVVLLDSATGGTAGSAAGAAVVLLESLTGAAGAGAGAGAGAVAGGFA